MHKYGESEDGEIEFVSLTKDKLEATIFETKRSFWLYENTCKAIGVSNNPKAIEECAGLCREVAKDGISIIAIQKKTGRVVGYSFNKLIQKQDPNTPQHTFTANPRTCTQPEFIGFIEWLQQIESLCDLFRLCRTDCIMEIMFVGTVSDFWGRRIGNRLTEASLKAGRRLRAGEDVRVPVDGEKLPPRPTPKIASAVLTSHKTQKIAKRLGSVVAVEVPADTFECDGKKLEFEPETKTVQISYMVLE